MFPPLKRRLINQYARDAFVRRQLSLIPAGSLILDAGSGTQPYRPDCGHLTYRAQDFGGYTTDDKKMLGCEGAGGKGGFRYGKLDYVGDIWAIDEKDGSFDAILCSEVLEHIPYPIDALREFSRLLKPGGTLILTAPSNCLRHMDPYFFYSGFSDRWFERFLPELGFDIGILEPVGDYYSWMAVEVNRTSDSHSFLAKMILAPAFFYYAFKRKTKRSVDTLCTGYHVVARKRAG
ncbi:MAG TPA: class I SAM-dependent methyltransferase [Candidatus Udaeobacter sp.]|nr:class I SAM-dependent methyltransferase [Candidatus Udaeobacter sp.]